MAAKMGFNNYGDHFGSAGQSCSHKVASDLAEGQRSASLLSRLGLG